MSETSNEPTGNDDAGTTGTTGSHADNDERETPDVGLIADEELPEDLQPTDDNPLAQDPPEDQDPDHPDAGNQDAGPQDRA